MTVPYIEKADSQRSKVSIGVFWLFSGQENGWVQSLCVKELGCVKREEAEFSGSRDTKSTNSPCCIAFLVLSST